MAAVRKETPLVLDNMNRYFAAGSNVSPQVAFRELIVNSLEASASHIEIGGVVVKGTPKVYVKDNGKGMNGRDHVQYLSRLGHSGEKNHDEHFGQGGRKATVGKNPHGIVYTSTKNGEMAETKVYFNGDVFVAGSTKVKKVKPQAPNGTEITFLGKSAKDETHTQFGTQQDIINFLTRRFLALPTPVTVQVFGKKVEIHGIRQQLEARSKSIIPSDALGGNITARFYLLSEASSHLSGVYVALRESNGVEEIYEHRSASELTKYGIDAAIRRVALVIELTASEAKAQFDRTTLMVKDKSLSEFLNNEEAWPLTFKNNLPEEVKAFEQEERDRQATVQGDKFEELLANIAKLYPGLSLFGGLKPKVPRPPKPFDPNSKPPYPRPKPYVKPTDKAGEEKGAPPVPLFLDNPDMEHMVSHNPNSFSISFNFTHHIATRYLDQFTLLYESSQKEAAREGLCKAWKLLTVELVYAAHYSTMGSVALSPEALTLNLLARSRAFKLASLFVKGKPKLPLTSLY